MSLQKNSCQILCFYYHHRSGSMANLEMAIQLAKSNKKPTNQILFAFWGAEELGLLGSRHFVQRLTENGAISNIALNLNYDMIVS